MDALIAALLAWLDAHGKPGAAAVPHPAVVELTLVALTREYYSAAPDAAPADGRDERINALYAATDGPRGTIYVIAAALVEGSDDFDDAHDNPLWREILLHELVHHVQWQTGAAAGFACAAEGEGEAYALGGRYLAAMRTTDPLPNRNFWARIYSRC